MTIHKSNMTASAEIGKANSSEIHKVYKHIAPGIAKNSSPFPSHIKNFSNNIFTLVLIFIRLSIQQKVKTNFSCTSRCSKNGARHL